MLKHYRELEAHGGWGTIDKGSAKLQIGLDDRRVVQLRARLGAEGYRVDPEGTVFDEEVEAAVKDFQRHHGLNEDGVVGPTDRNAPGAISPGA